MAPKVSVVTPIYNVAPFLPKCLDSLIGQTLKDIEFICVNDGSTDNSLEILKEYAAKDDRIVIIDKPNGGYGHTMNRGIEAAHGEYIGIVESDDWVYANAFEELYKLAEENGHCDIVKANYNTFMDGGEPSLVENFPPEMCGRLMSPLDDDGQKVINSIPAIWAAIYRKEFLDQKGIRFLETPGASFQDTGFVFKSWIAADSFVLTHDAYLNYRVDNAGSSVKSAAKVLFVCDEFASIEQFLDTMPERREKLYARVLAKKFDTYCWNYDRIAWEFRRDFLYRIASEFAEPLWLGQIDPTVFRAGEYERLCAIVNDPNLVYQSDLGGSKSRTLAKVPRVVAKTVGNGVGAVSNAIGTLRKKVTSEPEPQSHEDVKVSIVVPVYNSEKYLKKTLESLLGQTHKNLEVICVNDGSKDSSLSILEQFAAKDARLVVVDKVNEGPSKARNIGIEHVTGDYLCFVDSDDFISRSAIAQLVNAAETNDAEVVIYGINEYRDDTHIYHSMGHAVVRGVIPVQTVFDPREINNFFANMVGFTANKMYRMSYFAPLGIRFLAIGAHEDMPFTYAAVAAAHRVYYLDKPLYHYRRARAEGSRSDDTEKQFEYMLKALECMQSELERLDILKDYQQSFDNYVMSMCRWKFASICGKPRRAFYERITSGWLESMGVMGKPNAYFYDMADRRFAWDIEKTPYIDMVEYENEKLVEDVKSIYESRSFGLAEMIATPVRMLREYWESVDE